MPSVFSNNLLFQWEKTFEQITLAPSGVQYLTWTFPLTFNNIIIPVLQTAQHLTDRQGATPICVLCHCTLSEILWAIKNNSTTANTFSVVQFVYIMGY